MTDTWNCPSCGLQDLETPRKCPGCHYLRPAQSDDLIDLVPSAESLRDRCSNKMVKTVMAAGEHRTDDLTETLVDIAMGQKRNWTLAGAQALADSLSADDRTVAQFLEDAEL